MGRSRQKNGGGGEQELDMYYLIKKEVKAAAKEDKITI